MVYMGKRAKVTKDCVKDSRLSIGWMTDSEKEETSFSFRETSEFCLGWKRMLEGLVSGISGIWVLCQSDSVWKTETTPVLLTEWTECRTWSTDVGRLRTEERHWDNREVATIMPRCHCHPWPGKWREEAVVTRTRGCEVEPCWAATQISEQGSLPGWCWCLRGSSGRPVLGRAEKNWKLSVTAELPQPGKWYCPEEGARQEETFSYTPSQEPSLPLVSSSSRASWSKLAKKKKMLSAEPQPQHQRPSPERWGRGWETSA